MLASYATWNMKKHEETQNRWNILEISLHAAPSDILATFDFVFECDSEKTAVESMVIEWMMI